MKKTILFILFAIALVTSSCKSTRNLQTVKVDSTSVTAVKTQIDTDTKQTVITQFTDTTKTAESTVITIFKLDTSRAFTIHTLDMSDSLNLPVIEIIRIEKNKTTKSGASTNQIASTSEKVKFKSRSEQKTELDKSVKDNKKEGSTFWVKLSFILLAVAAVALSILFIKFKS